MEQSSSPLLCAMWYLSVHTQQALLWKHPFKYLPPCLLCFYSSHPRIVSFFFFLSLPVPPSCLWLTTLQWKPQFSQSLVPLFPLYSSRYQRNSSVFVGECTLRGIPSRLPVMGYYGDGKYQAGETWVLHDSNSWPPHTVFSQLFPEVVMSPWLHSPPGGHFWSHLVLRGPIFLPGGYSFSQDLCTNITCWIQSQKWCRTCDVAKRNITCLSNAFDKKMNEIQILVLIRWAKLNQTHMTRQEDIPSLSQQFYMQDFSNQIQCFIEQNKNGKQGQCFSFM